MARQPNILLISTDQQRADHLDCYGNPVVRTPAIDSLAARGTVFDRFYVACPICMPNRAAILTGRMPTVNGTRQNGIPLARDAVTFVDVLRAGGYHTGLVGKCHAQNITGKPLEVAAIFPQTATGTPPPEALAEAGRERLRSRPICEWSRGPHTRPLHRMAHCPHGRRQRAPRPEECPARARVGGTPGLANGDAGGTLSDELHRGGIT